MKLKRKKIGDRNYDIVDAVTGEVVANVVMTGEWGRDDYPWEWSLAGGKHFDVPADSNYRPSEGRSMPTLTEAVDYITTNVNRFGLTSAKPQRAYTAYLYETIGHAALGIPMDQLVRREDGGLVTATYAADDERQARAYFSALPTPKRMQRWGMTRG